MEKRQVKSEFRVTGRATSVAPGRAAILAQQKRLRSAHADRYAFADESKALVKKQRSKIDFLLQESLALKDGVVGTFQRNFVRSLNLTEAGREEGRARLRAQIMQEEARLAETDAKIRIFERQILVKKQQTGGSNSGLEIQNALAKEIKILENRLDKSTQKFNEMVTVNSSLRLEIDSFNKEKTMFQT